MAIPFIADLDVRLVKGRELKRFKIETCGASAWLIVADGVREVVTDSARLLRRRDALRERIDALVADGWSALSVNDAQPQSC